MSTLNGRKKIIVLVATFNRPELLVNSALQSIAVQTLLPDLVIIINDGELFTVKTIDEIKASLGNIPVQVERNKFSKGAAGSWNSGIKIIKKIGGNPYVAILDDDDFWDSNHLQVCFDTAESVGADAVVSGLRLWLNGELWERPLIKSIREEDFLVGNPGWQGSNTFVKLDKLIEINGFLDGMPSLNDRYLAIKLLELPCFVIAFSNQWTSNWNCSTSAGSLSSPRSLEKRIGLNIFWTLFNNRMNLKQQEAFFQRAYKLFDIRKNEILMLNHRKNKNVN